MELKIFTGTAGEIIKVVQANGGRQNQLTMCAHDPKKMPPIIDSWNQELETPIPIGESGEQVPVEGKIPWQVFKERMLHHSEVIKRTKTNEIRIKHI